MTKKPSYPKRPIRAVLLMFFGLSAFFAVWLAFQDDVPPQAWPSAFGYCALLPTCVIGIARLGARAFLILAGLALLPMALGVAGVALDLRNDLSLGTGHILLRVSLYLFYALGVAALVLSARGWILYWRQTKSVRAH